MKGTPSLCGRTGPSNPRRGTHGLDLAGHWPATHPPYVPVRRHKVCRRPRPRIGRPAPLRPCPCLAVTWPRLARSPVRRRRSRHCLASSKPMPVEAPVTMAKERCAAMLESPAVTWAGQGLSITLMQPSCLSRKVLYISGPRSSGTLWVITKDGSISPFSIRSRSFGR
jgi:hypothetical protein